MCVSEESLMRMHSEESLMRMQNRQTHRVGDYYFFKKKIKFLMIHTIQNSSGNVFFRFLIIEFG